VIHPVFHVRLCSHVNSHMPAGVTLRQHTPIRMAPCNSLPSPPPPPPSQIQSTAYIGYECNRTASRLSQQNKQSRSQCVQLHQVIKIFNTRISSKPLRVCDGLPMRSKNTFVLVCWSQTSLSSRLIMPSTSCIQFKAPLTPPANTHAYTRPFQHNAETCRAGLCCHQALSPVRVVAGQKTKTQPQPGPQRVTTHSVGSVCVTMTTM
jgi:hypothetical protein